MMVRASNIRGLEWGQVTGVSPSAAPSRFRSKQSATTNYTNQWANSERKLQMKVTMNVDCTPEEARTFFGLPDVQPMQDHLLKEMQERLSTNLKAMDPDTMIRAWLPATMKGFEQLQDIFTSQLSPIKKR
jgi:Family of unknown function (DUF6489)